MNAKDVRQRMKPMVNLDNLVVIDLIYKVEREIEHSMLLNKHSAIIEFPELYSCDHMPERRAREYDDGEDFLDPNSETYRLDGYFDRMAEKIKKEGFKIEKAWKGRKKWNGYPGIVVSWF